MAERKIVGYQLINADQETPAAFTSFEILSLRVVKEWQLEHPLIAEDYQVIKIRVGDVERPTFLY
jgi:hypothetical protein